jgi:hypothetical protein
MGMAQKCQQATSFLSLGVSVFERQLLAQSCHSPECPLLGEQRKTYARIEVFRF